MHCACGTSDIAEQIPLCHKGKAKPVPSPEQISPRTTDPAPMPQRRHRPPAGTGSRRAPARKPQDETIQAAGLQSFGMPHSTRDRPQQPTKDTVRRWT